MVDHQNPSPKREPAHPWLTWANGLTLLRLLSIGPATWAIVSGHWLLAAVLFTLGVLSWPLFWTGAATAVIATAAAFAAYRLEVGEGEAMSSC